MPRQSINPRCPRCNVRHDPPMHKRDEPEGAAQEGERGGAEVAAAERAALAFAVCPDLTHTIADGHDVCEAATDALVARVAGALAKHDAEVLLRLCARVPLRFGWSSAGVMDWIRAEADRIEAQS